MFREIVKKHGRPGGATNADLVVAIHSSGPANGRGSKPRPQIVFKLSERVMKQLRWVRGDYIKILIDETADPKLGLLERTTDPVSGFKLSVGNRISARFNTTEFPAETPKYSTPDNVTISDRGILFDWPTT